MVVRVLLDRAHVFAAVSVDTRLGMRAAGIDVAPLPKEPARLTPQSGRLVDHGHRGITAFASADEDARAALPGVGITRRT